MSGEVRVVEGESASTKAGRKGRSLQSTEGPETTLALGLIELPDDATVPRAGHAPSAKSVYGNGRAGRKRAIAAMSSYPQRRVNGAGCAAEVHF